MPDDDRNPRSEKRRKLLGYTAIAVALPMFLYVVTQVHIDPLWGWAATAACLMFLIVGSVIWHRYTFGPIRYPDGVPARKRTLHIFDDGFVFGDNLGFKVSFSSINRVLAYKSDWPDPDLLCAEILLELEGEETTIRIDEGQYGFYSVLDRITSMPGGILDWREARLVCDPLPQPVLMFQRAAQTEISESPSAVGQNVV